MHRRQRGVRTRRQVRGGWPVAAPEPLSRPAPPVDVRVVNRGVEAAIREHELRATFPSRLLELPLATATVDLEVEFRGTHLALLPASSNNSEVRVKTRGVDSDAIPFVRGDSRRVNYNKLYLSWDAQAGRTALLLLEFDVP